MRKTAVVVALLPLFLFCGGVETTVVFQQSYGFSKGNQPPKLSICISDKNPVIDYTGNVEDEFGKGDKNQLIWAFFKDQLAADIRQGSIFSAVEYDELSSSPATEPKVVHVKGLGDVAFALPSEAANVDCKATTPDVILFLDGISITSKLNISGSPGYYMGNNMYSPASFSSEKNLVYEARMILWDRNAKKTVSYGLLRVVDKSMFAVTKENWLAATANFVGKILEGTPFTKQ